MGLVSLAGWSLHAIDGVVDVQRCPACQLLHCCGSNRLGHGDGDATPITAQQIQERASHASGLEVRTKQGVGSS